MSYSSRVNKPCHIFWTVLRRRLQCAWPGQSQMPAQQLCMKSTCAAASSRVGRGYASPGRSITRDSTCLLDTHPFAAAKAEWRRCPHCCGSQRLRCRGTQLSTMSYLCDSCHCCLFCVRSLSLPLRCTVRADTLAADIMSVMSDMTMHGDWLLHGDWLCCTRVLSPMYGHHMGTRKPRAL